MQDFWHRVLVGVPLAEKGLCLRSAGHWIGIFNRWQSAGGWQPGCAPGFVDAYQLQELLDVPMQRTMEWVRLFDPPGYERLKRSRSSIDHKKVRVNVPAFMTAGIFVSTAISKRQKMRFLLVMFDENDSSTFEA